VFPVIALAVGQAEQPLLQDRIACVPHRNRETQPLAGIGEAADAVFTPAIRPAAGVVMREIVPGVSVRAIVFPHRSPLPLRQVGAPLLPSVALCEGCLDAKLLSALASHDCSLR